MATAAVTTSGQDVPSYSSVLLAELDSQRKAAAVAGAESDRVSKTHFCDVSVRCGGQECLAHSCVLAAASGFFEKVINRTKKEAEGQELPRPDVLEVGDLFVGVEHLFEDILAFLYSGAQSPALNEEVVSSLDSKLDLRAWKKSRKTKGSRTHQQISTPQAPAAKRSTATVSRDAEKSSDSCKMDVSFCFKCDLLFISKDEFMAHRMLDCTRKFTCKTCGTMFTKVGHLLDHLVEVRHGETMCSVCLLALPSSHELEAHVSRHLAERDKPYFCQKCPSRFSSRNALAQHVPKHSPETPFICQICSKGFKWKHALTAHMIVHSTKKNFQCEVCGFATSHASVLKHHQRIHSGQTLKCTFPNCTFETVRKSNLVQHQLTHSKEKAHQCEVCGKSFGLVKNMRRHAKQHDARAQRLECAVGGCGFVTLRSDKFVQHTRKHLQEEGHEHQGDDSGLSLSAKAAAAGTTAIKAAMDVSGAVVAERGSSKLKNMVDMANPPNRTVGDTLGEEGGDPPDASSRQSQQQAEDVLMDQSLIEMVVIGRDLDLLAAVAIAPEGAKL